MTIVLGKDDSHFRPPAGPGGFQGASSRVDSVVPRLQAFRGCGCVMVAMMHAAQSLSGADHAGFGFIAYDVVFNGRAAVTMFFVLSGFVLFLSLERGPCDLPSAALRFVVARILRLYLPIVGNLALLWFLFRGFGAALPGVSAAAYDLPALLRNAILLDTTINGVTWTLQLEVLAVPLIFVGYLVSRRFGSMPLIILLGILVGMSFYGKWSKLVSDAASLGLSYTFVLGMLIPGPGRQLVESLSRRQAHFLMIVSFIVLMLTREVVGYGKNWSPIIEAHCSFLLIAGVTYRPELTLFRPLDAKLAHFFGKVSYSFYLMHPVWLIAIWPLPSSIAAWLAAGTPGPVVALLLGAGLTLATVPLAYLSYRTFEKPSLRMIRAFERYQTRALPARCAVQ